MPRDRDLEQGTSGNYSGEHRNGTNCVSWSLEKHCAPSHMLILCVVAILLDPLFFYIPVINDKQKFLTLDKVLLITASVLRSVFDCFHIFFLIFRFSRYFINKNESQKTTSKDLWLFFFDLSAILPLPQVVNFFIMSTRRGSKTWNAMRLLKFFVMSQYVPRAIRIYPLFTKVIAHNFVKSMWDKAAFNLLLYLLFAHLFGALWYFFAIERETACWMTACRIHSGCDPSSFYSNHSLADHTFINEFCPTKTQNTTMLDFGIYDGALQSRTVAATDFPQKLLHCFFWGLQSLSCFGQNLQTSTYIWEDLFAIVITISGLVLFVFFIGNFQIYLQYRPLRSEKITEKLLEIEHWEAYQNLPLPLQRQVTEHQRHIWRQTRGVAVEKFLSDLPRNLRREIKRELWEELLLKVEEFKEFRGPVRDELFDYLKPAFFSKDTRIVLEGQPIYEMLFVKKGELCGSVDACGEELVAWAKNNVSDLPLSTRTIVALTNVEGFTLTASDLRKAFHLKNSMNKAANRIQSAWFRLKKGKPSTGSTGGNDSGIQVAAGRFSQMLNAFRRRQRTHSSRP